MSMNDGTRVIVSPGLPAGYEPPSTAVTATPPATGQRCVFCEIVAGRGPAKIVQRCRRHDTIALVPLSPVVDGHVLFIPREHVADLANDPRVTGMVMECASAYAGRYPSANVLTSMGRPATQSVFHLHVHVVPRAEDDGLMLPWGTIYGENPADPHWCRVAQGLQQQLDRLRAHRAAVEGR